MKSNIVKTVLSDRIEFTLDGELHNVDEPAVVYNNGTMIWYKHGRQHREDGPAVCFPDGSGFWFKDGELHSVSPSYFVTVNQVWS